MEGTRTPADYGSYRGEETDRRQREAEGNYERINSKRESLWKCKGRTEKMRGSVTVAVHQRCTIQFVAERSTSSCSGGK